MFTQLERNAAPGTALAALAPGLDMVLCLKSGEDQTLLTIRDGAVVAADPGPHVMPSWTTRLAAAPEEWEEFLRPVPKPMHHDLFALLRRGAVAFEGDLHPVMSNLLYIKRLLASLRTEGTA